MTYTYLITCTATGQKYYGSRYARNCRPEDLGVTYFSSSKEVHRLIEQHGLSNFTFQVRKTFETKEEAIRWEFTVLRRLNADKSDVWLNKHNGDGRVNGGFYGKKHSPETLEKMRKVAQGRKRPDLTERNRLSKGKPIGPQSEEHRRKIGLAIKGKKRPDLAERNRQRAQYSS